MAHKDNQNPGDGKQRFVLFSSQSPTEYKSLTVPEVEEYTNSPDHQQWIARFRRVPPPAKERMRADGIAEMRNIHLASLLFESLPESEHSPICEHERFVCGIDDLDGKDFIAFLTKVPGSSGPDPLIDERQRQYSSLNPPTQLPATHRHPVGGRFYSRKNSPAQPQPQEPATDQPGHTDQDAADTEAETDEEEDQVRSTARSRVYDAIINDIHSEMEPETKLQNSTNKPDQPGHIDHDATDAEAEPDTKPEWHKPLPIETTLLSVLSVSRSMLPEKLWPWLDDISNRMKCPLDFLAAAAIVALSSLIGTRLSIKPKTRDSWTITPNLWGSVIGDPSTMKTGSTGEVFKALNRLIAESRKQFEDEMKAYEIASVEYEAQKKAYTAQAQDRHKGKSVNNTVNYPEAPKKPTERRYMTNDATIEKLADILNENPTGVLQYRDELTGLLAGWERPGREEDRSFYLEAWNGNSSKTVDRIGRGTIHVNHLCVSLFGGIQPAKLLGYLKSATEYENDGFVQRLQVAVFPDKPLWDYVDEYPDARARDTAYALFQQIASSDFRHIAYDANEYERFPYTHFDAKAQEVFRNWLTRLQTEILPGETGLLLEHLTKYRSLMPSLALIFHVVNCVDAPCPNDLAIKSLVTVEAANMAVEWCEYLRSHARRIYGLLDTYQIEAAKSLLQHLKAGHLTNGFKARDVQRKGWKSLTTLEMVESALSELTAHYWLKEMPTPISTGGRPEALHYLINPAIIQNT